MPIAHCVWCLHCRVHCGARCGTSIIIWLQAAKPQHKIRPHHGTSTPSPVLHSLCFTALRPASVTNSVTCVVGRLQPRPAFCLFAQERFRNTLLLQRLAVSLCKRLIRTHSLLAQRGNSNSVSQAGPCGLLQEMLCLLATKYGRDNCKA